MKPWQVGTALALTVVLFYTLCTAAAIVWPGPFIGFVNDLFHGMDFGRLVTSDAYTLAAYGNAVWILGLWAFAMGSFFAWILRALTTSDFGRKN